MFRECSLAAEAESEELEPIGAVVERLTGYELSHHDDGERTRASGKSS